ncbi:MAG: type II DNA modification enzyme, partial [Blastocatellia bacterium]|nr:type II DNA modification enzyme [Blastocatellia bacterium]
MKSRTLFATIQTEGAILPADLLQRISAGDKDLGGLTPNDYHLYEGEKVNEAINRSWNRLLAAWSAFRNALEKLSPTDITATTVTREKWLLILFQELGYGRLSAQKSAITIEEKSYPISHLWQNVPIHLVGARIELDRRTPGVTGASKASPHGMLQELLNRSSNYLWAFLSNGLKLRLLRDNISLTRNAFVEFDLEAMMKGEVYADFALLWLLAHQSRIEAERPEEFWLEKWSRKAAEQGKRALDQLRNGVEKAISALGSGFLSHPQNRDLKEQLQLGKLSTQEYYRQLLRLVYRLLFLFVAEDRELLLDPDADNVSKERYRKHYSTARIRRLAEKTLGTRHSDLFVALKLVMDKLNNGG